MSDTPHYAIDPQAQTEIINAIVALDWSADPVRQPLKIIQERLGADEKRAIDLLESLKARNLIVCRPERLGNNMAETGAATRPVRSRWIRPDETMK